LGSNKRVTTKSPAAASSGEEREHEHSTREEKILTIPTILTLARVAAIPFVVLGKHFLSKQTKQNNG
jgi:hypothetical protein